MGWGLKKTISGKLRKKDHNMSDRNVELINIAKIDLLKGRVNVDLDSLSKILIDNYCNKFECEVESTYSEGLAVQHWSG